MVDKPLTMTARQAEELVDISRRKDLVLMTAFTRHFMASVEHVRQHIVDGEIGALQMITAVQRRYPGREARLMGGMFLCRAVHIVDLCPWLTGRQVVRVEGRVEYGDERDPKQRAKLIEISPLTRVGEISKPMFVITGANDPRVPKSEADQMVAAIRAKGGEAWHLVAADEGHGFRKKANADYAFLAQLMFWKKYLLGE